jgi:hypothetical protein
MLVLLMGRIYERCHSDDLRSHNIHSVPGGNVIIWEVIVSVILSKEVYMYNPIPNGFRDTAIVHGTLYRRALTRAAKCTDVDG